MWERLKLTTNCRTFYRTNDVFQWTITVAYGFMFHVLSYDHVYLLVSICASLVTIRHAADEMYLTQFGIYHEQKNDYNGL